MQPNVNVSNRQMLMPKRLENPYNGKHYRTIEERSKLYFPVAAKPGGSFPGAIYEKVRDKSKLKPATRYYGKPGFFMEEIYDRHNIAQSPSLPIHSIPNRKTKLDSTFQKIAFDVYDLLKRGYEVYKSLLVELPWENEYTKENGMLNDLVERVNEGRPENARLTKGLHILNKGVVNSMSLGEVRAVYNNEEINLREYIIKTGRPPEKVIIDSIEMPLVGLMEILAIGSKLIHDIDVMGEGADNILVVVKYDTKAKPYAQTVKIDPGYAFNQDVDNMYLSNIGKHKNTPLNDIKDIQYSTSRSVIRWKNLTPNQQKEFLTALEYGVNRLADVAVLDFLIFRQEKFNATSKLISLKSENVQKTIALLQNTIKELRKIYNIRQITYPDKLPNDNQEYVEVKPGPLVTLKHIKDGLNKWINDTPILDITGRERERRIDASKKIRDCYINEKTSLDLSNMQLISLPDDVFAYLENLTEINLSNNQFKNLPNDILEKSIIKVRITPELELVYITGLLNIWINDSPNGEKKSRLIAKDKILHCYQNRIEELVLSDLRITSLPNKKIFRYLHKLKIINLYNNKFSVTYQFPTFPSSIRLKFDEEQEINYILSKWVSESGYSIEERNNRINERRKIIEYYQIIKNFNGTLDFNVLISWGYYCYGFGSFFMEDMRPKYKIISKNKFFGSIYSGQKGIYHDIHKENGIYAVDGEYFQVFNGELRRLDLKNMNLQKDINKIMDGDVLELDTLNELFESYPFLNLSYDLLISLQAYSESTPLNIIVDLALNSLFYSKLDEWIHENRDESHIRARYRYKILDCYRNKSKELSIGTLRSGFADNGEPFYLSSLPEVIFYYFNWLTTLDLTFVGYHNKGFRISENIDRLSNLTCLKLSVRKENHKYLENANSG